MAFLGKFRKEDLIRLGNELGASVTREMKMIEIKKAVIACTEYEEELAKNLLETFVSERKEREEVEAEREKREEERQIREFELEKLRLQNEIQGRGNDARPEQYSTRVELQKILPKFNVNEDDISIFLLLFERQMKVLKVPEEMWVSHLIGTMPSEITLLIARETEEKSQDYKHMKSVLLQRFKLTAGKFRKLFTQHRKSPDSTWKDFYFEIRSYFEGWITELKVSEFQQLCDLIIADQLKKRCSPECKEHFLDEWEELICPKVLAEKLDAYDNIRNTAKPQKKPLNKPREEHTGKNNFFKSEKESYLQIERPSLRCYGCGKPGFIKAKCPNCSEVQKEDARLNSLQMYTCIESPARLPMVDIAIFGAKAIVCADTGATRTVGGELLYNFLVNRGQNFQELELTLTLADGQEKIEKVQECRVPIIVKGLSVPTSMIFLPKAKGNRTLLGLDFLEKAGIVLDPKKRCWFFGDNPRYRFPFAKEVPLLNNLVKKSTLNMCRLRDDERKNLTVPQKEKLNSLLGKVEKVLRPGGESTSFSEHNNTGSHPPVAVSPYRNKFYADKKGRTAETFALGNYVYGTLHPISSAANQKSVKFMPRRDGPDIILTQRSPTSYEIANLEKPQEPLGVYHSSALKLYQDSVETPIAPLRHRGRPPKKKAGCLSGRRRNQRGSL